MRITVNIPPEHEARVLAAIEAEAGNTPDRDGLKAYVINRIKGLVIRTEGRAAERAARENVDKIELT